MICMICKKPLTLKEEAEESELCPTPNYGICDVCLKKMKQQPVEIYDQ